MSRKGVSLLNICKHLRDINHGSSSFCTCRSLLPLSLSRKSSQLAKVHGEKGISRIQSPLASTPQFRNIYISSQLEYLAQNDQQRIVRNAAVEEAVEKESGVDDDGPDGPFKSHPYRNICKWKTKSELATVLLDNQLYYDSGLLIINKPFGVGVRNPTAKHLQKNNRSQQQLHLRGVQTSEYTLEDVLPVLRTLLDKPELVLVKSTEKLSSGIAVFAMNEKIGQHFSKALKSSKSFYDTFYKYHVITVLPPFLNVEPGEMERVGVTIKSGAGCDIPQPVIARGYSINSVKRGDVTSVHTKVYPLKLGFGGGALVEINTSQVNNNFLRIFCADKLAPILGDQLYSNRVQTMRGIPTKIDPTHLAPGASHQKLPKDMLASLKLNESTDSIIIPPHVHLRSYIVRKFLKNGAELEIEAPYPQHFKWTSEQLGIQLGVDEE